MKRPVVASGSSGPSRSVPLATMGYSGRAHLLVREPVSSHALGGDLVSVRESTQRPVSGSRSLVQGSKSYADLLRSSKASIEPLLKPQVPSIKRDFVSVRVDPVAYQSRIKVCKNALIGHVVLSSGERPWKLVDLKVKLSKHWMLSSDWHLISLGGAIFRLI